MILVYFTVGSTSSGSAFVIAPNLGAKILSEYFTGSAPPILCSWSYSQIGCSTPLYSRSVSLIGSAYLFLYISFCFWFNKLLTNLTSLRQHLQYISVIMVLCCFFYILKFSIQFFLFPFEKFSPLFQSFCGATTFTTITFTMMTLSIIC